MFGFKDDDQRLDGIFRGVMIANDRLFQEAKGLYDPYVQGGNRAVDALMYEAGLSEAPDDYRGYDQTPGYQFRLDEGTRALQGGMRAAGHGGDSGSVYKALQQYGQDYATQDYTRYLGQLSELAGLGQFGVTGQAGVLQNRINTNLAEAQAREGIKFQSKQIEDNRAAGMGQLAGTIAGAALGGPIGASLGGSIFGGAASGAAPVMSNPALPASTPISAGALGGFSNTFQSGPGVFGGMPMSFAS